jgi:hypothetical protein
VTISTVIVTIGLGLISLGQTESYVYVSFNIFPHKNLLEFRLIFVISEMECG